MQPTAVMLNNHHHGGHPQQQHQVPVIGAGHNNNNNINNINNNNQPMTTSTTATTNVVVPTPVRKKSRKDVPLSSSPGLLVSSSSGSPAGQQAGESDGGHSSDGCGDRKRKKARTTFTGRQIFELEKQFELKKYLSSSERSEMAKLLSVTETQVRNSWRTFIYHKYRHSTKQRLVWITIFVFFLSLCGRCFPRWSHRWPPLSFSCVHTIFVPKSMHLIVDSLDNIDSNIDTLFVVKVQRSLKVSAERRRIRWVKRFCFSLFIRYLWIKLKRSVRILMSFTFTRFNRIATLITDLPWISRMNRIREALCFSLSHRRNNC